MLAVSGWLGQAREGMLGPAKLAQAKQRALAEGLAQGQEKLAAQVLAGACAGSGEQSLPLAAWHW